MKTDQNLQHSREFASTGSKLFQNIVTIARPTILWTWQIITLYFKRKKYFDPVPTWMIALYLSFLLVHFIND